MQHKIDNVLIIIQARVSSTRLKHKIFLELSNYECWYLVYKRLNLLFNNIIFAIPDNDENLELYKKIKEKKINVFRGLEDNVLKRYIDALDYFGFNNFVRICADNPYTCPYEIKKLIKRHNTKSTDYSYNNAPINNLYPDGFGGEFSSLDVLKKIYKFTSKSEREHIFNYIKNNKNKFKIKTFNPSIQRYRRPDLNFEINTKEDYNKLVSIKLNWKLSMEQILERCLN